MYFMRRLIVLLLPIALLGCDRDAMFEKFIPKDEEAIAKGLIAKLSARDYPAVEAKVDKSLQSSDMRRKLEEIAELIPAEVPKSTHTIGAIHQQIQRGHRIRSYNRIRIQRVLARRKCVYAP